MVTMGTKPDLSNRNETSSRHTGESLEIMLNSNKDATKTSNEKTKEISGSDKDDSASELVLGTDGVEKKFERTKKCTQYHSPKQSISQQVYVFFFSDGDSLFGAFETDFPFTCEVEDHLQDWELPSEAFELRHPIGDYAIHPEIMDSCYDLNSLGSIDDYYDETSDNSSTFS